MELALSLGENHTSKSFSVLVEKGKTSINSNSSSAGVGGGDGGKRSGYGGMDLGLVLSSSNNNNNNNNNNNLSRSSSSWSSSSSQDNGGHPMEEEEKKRGGWSSSPSDPLPPRPLATAPPLPPHQLDLLPFSPVPRPQLHFPWLSDNSAVTCAADQPTTMDSSQPRRPADANRYPSLAPTEEAEDQSSPNSALSSFMEFSLYRKNRGAGDVCGKSSVGNGMELVVFEGGGGDQTVGERGTSSRAGSDDDEMNGLLIGGGGGFSRKKLRLSKEQSAFLEDSFKEHHTLNPKQKLALAKQLNLRPRQVEVWFQNRRARTKLKQTEVDCEYLKRCCETLTDENRRLQKELHELRALKSSQPFFMHLPATTLTMCPSCERVASAPSSAPAARSSSAAQPVAARAAATNGPRPPAAAAAAGTCAATATAAVCL